MSLRGIARSKATQQSEAIHNGIASTIIPINANDHDSILGSALLEAMPLWIALIKDISRINTAAIALSFFATTTPLWLTTYLLYQWKTFKTIEEYKSRLKNKNKQTNQITGNAMIINTVNSLLFN